MTVTIVIIRINCIFQNFHSAFPGNLAQTADILPLLVFQSSLHNREFLLVYADIPCQARHCCVAGYLPTELVSLCVIGKVKPPVRLWWKNLYKDMWKIPPLAMGSGIYYLARKSRYISLIERESNNCAQRGTQLFEIPKILNYKFPLKCYPAAPLFSAQWQFQYTVNSMTVQLCQFISYRKAL